MHQMIQFYLFLT